MSGHAKACPKCGGTRFLDNNGIDHKTRHTGVHLGIHSGMHGHPLMAAVGLTAAAIGMAFPKKRTCANPECRHTIKG